MSESDSFMPEEMKIVGQFFLKKLSESPQDLVDGISFSIEKDLGENPLSDQELVIILYVSGLLSSIETMNMATEFLLATRKVYDFLNGTQYFHNIHRLLVGIANKDTADILKTVDVLVLQMKAIFETKLAPAISQKVFVSTFISFARS